MPISRRVLAEKPDEYIKRLLSLGMKRIGRGTTSTVFQHPTVPNLVVKIGRFKRNGRTSMAYDWLMFAQSESDNPFLPKISHLQVLHDVELNAWEFNENGAEMYICMMEKLSPATAADVEKMIADYGIESCIVRDPNARPGRVQKMWDVTDNKADIAKIKNHHLRSVIATLDYMSSISNNDFAVDNLLMRGRQLVFVDPVG